MPTLASKLAWPGGSKLPHSEARRYNTGDAETAALVVFADPQQIVLAKLVNKPLFHVWAYVPSRRRTSTQPHRERNP